MGSAAPAGATEATGGEVEVGGQMGQGAPHRLSPLPGLLHFKLHSGSHGSRRGLSSAGSPSLGCHPRGSTQTTIDGRRPPLQLPAPTVLALALLMGLRGGPPLARGQDCARLVKDGVDLLNQQNLTEAQEAFLSATRACPTNAEAQKYLGLTYDQQGRPADAQQAFRRAIALNPRDAGTHNDLAVSYFRSGNPDSAVKEFQNTLRLDPHNVPANGNLAAYYLSQKKFAQALGCLLAVHADQSQDLLLLLELTQADFGAGKHREGVATAARLSRLAGSNPQMHFSLGLTLAENGEFQSALKEFSALPESERDAAVYMNLGTVYGKLRRFPEAKEAFAQAIRLDPSNSEPYFQIGLNCLQAGKRDEALYWLGQAHEKDAKRTDVTEALAEALIQAQHLDRARDLLTAAQEQAPHDPAILQAVGDLHFNLHEDEEALRAYQQCLQLDPRRVESRLALARLYERQNQIAEEKAEYGKVLQIDPQNSAAHAGLGHVALQSGSVDLAAKELQAALRLNPNDLRANEDLAVVRLRQGGFEEARAICEKLVAADPNNPSYHYQLGQALLKLGRKDEAQREFTRSQELKASESRKPG